MKIAAAVLITGACLFIATSAQADEIACPTSDQQFRGDLGTPKAWQNLPLLDR
jgi:hypothetical protein